MAAHAASTAVVGEPPFDAPPSVARLRVAVAHDWLVRYAGSERVVAELLALLPQSTLLTTVLNADALPRELRAAETSFLQRLPRATSHHEWLLPLMPLAWRARRPLDDVDVVVSSSHACAKAVRVAAGVPHVSYCHTPMRYAWDYAAERERFPKPVRLPAAALMAGFRRWDRSAASRVTQFVANSNAVAARIRRFYGRDSVVVHPPVRTDFFTPGGHREDFFLYVGRLVAYKNAELVVRAFAELPHERLVVVGRGHLEARLRALATPNVEFVPSVDDYELRALYRSARALVYPADEDFGIVMAEAQACGTPVVALAAGGALDIVVDGETGVLLREPTPRALRAALREVKRLDPKRSLVAASAARFSAASFRSAFADVLEAVVRQ
jgi:glycosyltransferase involved in cell wall biosynthesis